MHIYVARYNSDILRGPAPESKTYLPPNVGKLFIALGPKYQRENTKAYGRNEKTIWIIGILN